MSAPKPEMLEKIVAAAIRVGPVVHTGPHHATIVHQIVACGGETPVTGAQGFMTSNGRMVSRSIARKIAFAAGQIATDDASLFSEELWNVPEPNWEALRASEASVESLRKERDGLLYTSDKQTVAWKERALDAEADAERLHTEKMQHYDRANLAEDALEAARAEATKAVMEKVVQIAKEAHAAWDSDKDSRVGKILIALAYGRPGYRADIDELWAAIRAPSPPEPRGEPSSVSNQVKPTLRDTPTISEDERAPDRGGSDSSGVTPGHDGSPVGPSSPTPPSSPPRSRADRSRRPPSRCCARCACLISAGTRTAFRLGRGIRTTGIVTVRLALRRAT